VLVKSLLADATAENEIMYEVSQTISFRIRLGARGAIARDEFSFFSDDF
jgi:hypothetical protein